jgi:hypothetical protein
MGRSPIGSFASGFAEGFIPFYNAGFQNAAEKREGKQKDAEKTRQRQELLKRYEVLTDPNATDEEKKSAYAFLQVNNITPPSAMLETKLNAQGYLDSMGIPKNHPLRGVADNLDAKQLYDEVTKTVGEKPMSLEDFQILEENGILPEGLTANEAYGLNYLATSSKLPAGIISSWADKLLPGKPSDPVIAQSMLNDLMYDRDGKLKSFESYTPSEFAKFENLGFSPEEVQGWYKFSSEDLSAVAVQKIQQQMITDYSKDLIQMNFINHLSSEQMISKVADFARQVFRMNITGEPTDRIKKMLEFINSSEAKKTYPNAQAMYVAMIEAHNDPSTEFSRYSIAELRLAVQYLFPEGGKLIWTPEKYQAQEKLENVGDAKKKFEKGKK